MPIYEYMCEECSRKFELYIANAQAFCGRATPNYRRAFCRECGKVVRRTTTASIAHLNLYDLHGRTFREGAKYDPHYGRKMPNAGKSHWSPGFASTDDVDLDGRFNDAAVEISDGGDCVCNFCDSGLREAEQAERKRKAAERAVTDKYLAEAVFSGGVRPGNRDSEKYEKRLALFDDENLSKELVFGSDPTDGDSN